MHLAGFVRTFLDHSMAGYAAEGEKRSEIMDTMSGLILGTARIVLQS